MTSFDLLNAIGQAQDAYICAAADTKRNQESSHSPRRLSRRMLIAAILILILLLTACAAVFGRNLFTTYFQSQPGKILSSSQIQFIEENTQPTIAQSVVSQSANGYRVYVSSALTDGIVAYITVDFTAPEGISLEKGQILFLENPLLIPTPGDGLLLAPDGSAMDAMCEYETIDDGDGQANTTSILFTVNPRTLKDGVKPFDGNIQWRMETGDFELSTFHGDGFTDEPLDSGTWVFDLQFKPIETRELQFVNAPIAIKTSNWIENEYTHENRILSLALSGLNSRLELEHPDINGKSQDIGDVTIVMKDGTQQTLICHTAQSGPLNAPIDLDTVDYLLLADGSKLFRKDAVPITEISK